MGTKKKGQGKRRKRRNQKLPIPQKAWINSSKTQGEAETGEHPNRCRRWKSATRWPPCCFDNKWWHLRREAEAAVKARTGGSGAEHKIDYRRFENTIWKRQRQCGVAIWCRKEDSAEAAVRQQNWKASTKVHLQPEAARRPKRSRHGKTQKRKNTTIDNEKVGIQ